MTLFGFVLRKVPHLLPRNKTSFAVSVVTREEKTEAVPKAAEIRNARSVRGVSDKSVYEHASAT